MSSGSYAKPITVPSMRRCSAFRAPPGPCPSDVFAHSWRGIPPHPYSTPDGFRYCER
jgi:hypothetical protein